MIYSILAVLFRTGSIMCYHFKTLSETNNIPTKREKKRKIIDSICAQTVVGGNVSSPGPRAGIIDLNLTYCWRDAVFFFKESSKP